VATSPDSSQPQGPTRAFVLVAYVEAVTFIVLMSAVVLYRVFDGPRYISVLGPIHGIAWFAYFVLVLRLREELGWSGGKALRLLFMSIVPFGGFWAGREVAEPAPAT
jgi:integral membrane protein